jgi:hypothetical protein
MKLERLYLTSNFLGDQLLYGRKKVVVGSAAEENIEGTAD